jgi:hypothetical protein
MLSLPAMEPMPQIVDKFARYDGASVIPIYEGLAPNLLSCLSLLDELADNSKQPKDTKSLTQRWLGKKQRI